LSRAWDSSRQLVGASRPRRRKVDDDLLTGRAGVGAADLFGLGGTGAGRSPSAEEITVAASNQQATALEATISARSSQAPFGSAVPI
jgi:hypothetical protein